MQENKKSILVGIPVIYNGNILIKSVKSVIREADVLIIDNNSEPDVKNALNLLSNQGNISIIRNPKNVYVNPAWNQILSYFLASNYEQLVIMNSDLIMWAGWSEELTTDACYIPSDGKLKVFEEVFKGTPGVFIHLTKECAHMVYPIPKSIKIWFGDEWIYTILRKYGIKTIIHPRIICEHYQSGSQSVKKLPEFQEIIEQDKIAWKEIKKTL
jgi:hypothetical protein